ncbi:MAG TPA: HAMP domain-containing sensor histidine kinase, partial [Rariglobus sp.]
QGRLEWVFLGLMIGVSTVLTVLQFRWTGEVAEAELARLNDAIAEQSGWFAAEAGRELGEVLRALRPVAGESDDAWVAKIKKARQDGLLPLLRRLALVRSEGGSSGVWTPDFDAGTLKRTEWPEEWAELQRSFGRDESGFGGRPPVLSSGGLQLVFPFMPEPQPADADRMRRPEPGELREAIEEAGWLVVQLDAGYIRDHWMPELTRRYLHFAGGQMCDVVVRAGDRAEDAVLYATSKIPAGARASLTMPVDFSLKNKGWRGFRGGPGASLWTVEIYRKPEALETVVGSTRRKNLLAAFLLNGLILAAGGLLVRQTRRSRRLAETQMHFVAGVSHELRTPLTVIRGAAHNIRRGIVHDPDRIVHYASLVESHATQLSHMVEQVLEFSRAGKDGAKSVFRPLSLEGVIRDAVLATATEIQTGHCVVEVETPSSPVWINGDGDALRQAFQNLLVNAAKHGGAGGWIGVTATAVAGGRTPRVEVRVMDRGPGIPAREQADVFKPFFRGERARSTQVRGSGLGLSLVKTAIEAHGGRIRISSEPGAGATFIIELPAAAAPS